MSSFRSAKTSLKSVLNTVQQRAHWLSLASRQSEKPVPIYPAKSPEGIKVHIGSGAINVQGWINIDARAFAHTHIVATDFDLAMFTDGAISHIYLCHVLEHFPYSEVDSILRNFFRKLAPDGKVYISVPDFSRLVDVFQENKGDLNIIKSALMGGQDYAYNFHKAMFTEQTLTKVLEATGFAEIKTWETKDLFGAEVGDWSSRTLPTPHGARFISLNLCATKVGP